MNGSTSDKHYRWNLFSAIILLLGLGSGLAIYLFAPEERESVLGYTFVGDTMYSVVPDKMELHKRELYGGKLLVLAVDLKRWFVELWYGKSLGVTIACISIITAGLIFLFNNYVFFEDGGEHTE